MSGKRNDTRAANEAVEKIRARWEARSNFEGCCTRWAGWYA